MDEDRLGSREDGIFMANKNETNHFDYDGSLSEGENSV
jgi:hypothetical protein